MIIKNSSKAALIGFAVTVLIGCATTETAENQTLYDRLGRDEGVTNIVDNLLFELSENEKLIGYFARTDIDRFRSKLIEQICEVSDGPCEYTGDTMVRTHYAMDMDKSHFDSLVNDLVAAMEENGTPVGAQNDLLSRLAPMYDEVVNARDYPLDAE